MRGGPMGMDGAARPMLVVVAGDGIDVERLTGLVAGLDERGYDLRVVRPGEVLAEPHGGIVVVDEAHVTMSMDEVVRLGAGVARKIASAGAEARDPGDWRRRLDPTPRNARRRR